MRIPGQNLPFALPGLVLSLVVSVVLSGPVSRALRAHRLVGWLLVMSAGIIVTATMTPHRDALEAGGSQAVSCDFSRLGPASITDYLRVYDAGLNVLLFIPLGLAIGLAPWSRAKALALGGAVLFPVAIETYQLLTSLDRSCESGDVVDNLMGLAIGLAAGALLGRAVPALRRHQVEREPTGR